jgi:hypothetical protein
MEDGSDNQARGPARRLPSRVGAQGPGRVMLVRGRHTWRFEFGTEDRPALLAALEELAARTECPFDAFDAALVGHEACHGQARWNSGGEMREAA